MFDGLPQEQLHQFIASRPSSNNNNNNTNNINSLPILSPSFPQTTTTNFMISSNTFDSYPHSHHLLFPIQHQQQQQQQHDHQIFLHHHPIFHQTKSLVNTTTTIASHDQLLVDDKDVDVVQASLTVNLEMERDRQRSVMPSEPNCAVVVDGGDGDLPWTTDEVLSLLRIRSTMENWFPDFTWEHVSRKLAELGFKMRSGEKCKERFEEESRYLNNINTTNNCTKTNSFMPFLSELDEELYNHSHTNDNNNNNNNNKSQRSVVEVMNNNIPSCELLLDKRVLMEEQIVPKNNDGDEVFGAMKEKAVEEETIFISNNNKDNKKKQKKRKRINGGDEYDDDDYDEKMVDRDGGDDDDDDEKTKFEMFKGFCEEIVNKMMAQQEEMHNRLLEDMVKRDQEKLRKEEAWKRTEMDRMNKELDIIAQEQAISVDRQSTIIHFLTKFTSPNNNNNNNTSFDHGQSYLHDHDDHYSLVPEKVVVKSNKSSLVSLTPSSSSSSSLLLHQKSPNNSPEKPEPNPSNIVVTQNPSSLLNTTNPNPTNNNNINNNTNDQLQPPDLGKRWPRDEVLALINLRCSLYNNNNNNGSSDSNINNINNHQLQAETKEGGSSSTVKAVPLWERISQGMSEMGYKRSAKRCKEKWENINKYFRKTKDVNKKRSVDSRTCPYFQQLSSLYRKGTLVDNHHHHHHHHDQDRSSDQGDHHLDDNHDSSNSHVHLAQGERSETTNSVVPPAFDFEF